jgi:hypothetical protein
MQETLLALGRGIVKTLISLFIGSGVGLLTFGVSTRDMPDLWDHRGPPPGFFTAMGAGLLATGAMMVLMFALSRPRKAPEGKGVPDDELPR